MISNHGDCLFRHDFGLDRFRKATYNATDVETNAGSNRKQKIILNP